MFQGGYGGACAGDRRQIELGEEDAGFIVIQRRDDRTPGVDHQGPPPGGPAILMAAALRRGEDEGPRLDGAGA